jgi:hypothetical protein
MDNLYSSLYPDDGSFIINLQKVSTHKPFTKITRTLALDLMDSPYISVGDFFKGLNDFDLMELSALCERDDDDAISELLLLAEILSRAEGITSESPEEMGKKVGVLRLITAGVSLARKGLVEAYYQNMSFDINSGSKEIVFKAKGDFDPPIPL